MTTINMQRRFRGACGALLVALVIAISTAGSAQQKTATTDDYGYGAGYLTPEQREGRDTWYFWTGGNESFWPEMARITEGNVSLLNYIDSRRHDRRFRDLGAITQPGCEAATAPDEYRLMAGSLRSTACARCAGRGQRHRRSPEVSQPQVR